MKTDKQNKQDKQRKEDEKIAEEIFKSVKLYGG